MRFPCCLLEVAPINMIRKSIYNSFSHKYKILQVILQFYSHMHVMFVQQLLEGFCLYVYIFIHIVIITSERDKTAQYLLINTFYKFT